LQPTPLQRAFDLLIATAHAHGESCPTGAAAFTSCVNGIRVRDFHSCSAGGLTLSGNVTLSFSNSACSLIDVGSSVTRTPDFVFTGRRGTFTVSAENGGQRVTRTGAAAFTYEVLGVDRTLKNLDGKVLADVSSKTLEAIGVSGTTRADRILDGGTLELTNNLKGYAVTLSPSAVAWSSACACPTSGRFTGTVTGNNKAKDFTVEFLACGTAKVTVDDDTAEVELDRCTQ
jgi:hypothetical protein